jgi:hypothetical protein
METATTTHRPTLGSRGWRAALTALLMIALVVAIGGGVAQAGPAFPTGTAALADHGTIVEFGNDAVIESGETAGTVVAIGGDVYVRGTVDVAVAVGGDVNVNGTVLHTAVSIGNTVRVGPTGVIGSANAAGDTAVVLVGGKLVQYDGGTVNGKVTNVNGGWFRSAATWSVWNPIVRPFRPASIVGWGFQTSAVLVLAIILAAAMPRQVAAVGSQLRRRLGASLGWGALSSFIIIPVSGVILLITIVGILVVVPVYLIALPLSLLFASVAAATFIGSLMVDRDGSGSRDRLILSAVVGVLVVSVVRLVPVAGTIAFILLCIAGFGAVILALGEWRRQRKLAKLAAAVAAASPAPDGGQNGFPPLPPVPPTPPAIAQSPPVVPAPPVMLAAAPMAPAVPADETQVTQPLATPATTQTEVTEPLATPADESVAPAESAADTAEPAPAPTAGPAPAEAEAPVEAEATIEAVPPAAAETDVAEPGAVDEEPEAPAEEAATEQASTDGTPVETPAPEAAPDDGAGTPSSPADDVKDDGQSA